MTYDVKKNYLWGHNDAYPVAEGVGTGYTTVPATPELNLSVIESTNGQQVEDENDKLSGFQPNQFLCVHPGFGGFALKQIIFALFRFTLEP